MSNLSIEELKKLREEVSCKNSQCYASELCKSCNSFFISIPSFLNDLISLREKVERIKSLRMIANDNISEQNQFLQTHNAAIDDVIRLFEG